MADMLAEVDCFRRWADAFPPGLRSGEWECDYADWGMLHQATLEFVALRPFAAWSARETAAVLYAVARDNESQHLVEEIRVRHPTTLLRLAGEAVRTGERDARWQLAEELGRLQPGDPDVERILLALADDGEEYVRRRALQALARLGSPAVEGLACREWHRPHEHQQWMRMGVLWSLHRVGSPLLPGMLDDAEKDPRTYLRDFAGRVRNGQVDP